MKDEPIKTCPECGGRVKRLLGTGAGFIFKGPGFYATDYKKADKKPKKKDTPDACKECPKKDCDLKKD